MSDPRVPTRGLAILTAALVALFLAAAVVGWLVTRQPAMTPVPVPSVSQL